KHTNRHLRTKASNGVAVPTATGTSLLPHARSQRVATLRMPLMGAVGAWFTNSCGLDVAHRRGCLRVAADRDRLDEHPDRRARPQREGERRRSGHPSEDERATEVNVHQI